MIPLLFVVAITVATLVIGYLASRGAKTAADMMVAGRSVGVGLNAAAISGEYLSAASFLGIAGLVMKNGFDALWYPVGYAAGYLFLLLFIAGPLRRFGAYTIPDFAEGRFDSPRFRRIAVLFVLGIGFFYTMPQMKGAGVVMGTILGWPYWAGIAVVGSVITFNVATGGMKGITLVQAFQYWAKLFAISVPVFVIVFVGQGYGIGSAIPGGGAVQRHFVHGVERFGGNFGVEPDLSLGKNVLAPQILNNRDQPDTRPVRLTKVIWPPGVPEEERLRFERRALGSYPMGSILPDTVVVFRDGSMAIVRFRFERQILIRSEGRYFEQGAVFEPRFRISGADKAPQNRLSTAGFCNATLYVKGSGRVKRNGDEGTVHIYRTGLPFGSPVKSGETEELRAGDRLYVRRGGSVEFLDKITGTLVSASGVPNRPERDIWLNPFGPLTQKHGYPLLYTFSLIVALVCGTAGLPHILVRFYTNPDGKAARRTAFWTMVMLGAFYVFTPVWSTLGRALLPILYANNSTDSVVIRLPEAVVPGVWGQILTGVTSAGAFAAFMSTFSGLLVSMSGAFAHDVYGTMIRPNASSDARKRAFQLAAVVIGIVAMGLGLLVETFDIATMVGWAFAIGAASYFPLLLLGTWWRGLTATGAATGMLLGGLLSLAAIVTSMLLDKKTLTLPVSPLVRGLMEQPAIWGVPLSIVTMVVVSKMTKPPAGVTEKMLRLHRPEGV